MDINSSKIELAKLVLTLQNPDLISQIRELILRESVGQEHELPATLGEEIKMGLEQLERGERIDLNELILKLS